MVLLLLGCESEDRIGMLSQNPVFVLTMLDMTNEQEIALGKSQERQDEGGKYHMTVYYWQTDIRVNSYRMVDSEDNWEGREKRAETNSYLQLSLLKSTTIWVYLFSFWEVITFQG